MGISLRNDPDNGKVQAGNSSPAIPGDGYLSYYRDGMENVGGLKVKWKIRVVTGPEAVRLDARQNAAIKELLAWASQHQHFRRTR
jgi:hypothetical protein